MNIKKLRLLLPLTLIMSLMLALTANAAPTAPAFTSDICVELDGSHPNGEPLTVTLSPDGGGADIVKTTSAGSDGCFTIDGVLQGNYAISITGEDTFTRTHDPVALLGEPRNFVDGNTQGLPILKLHEGDINQDSNVNGADFGLMAAGWLTNSSQPGDLNEDTNVNGADFGMLAGNWLTSARGVNARVAGASSRAPLGDASISIESVDPALAASFADGDDLFFKIILNNPSLERITNVQLDIQFNDTYLEDPDHEKGDDCVDTDFDSTIDCAFDLLGPGEDDTDDRYTFNLSSSGGAVAGQEILVAILVLEAHTACDNCRAVQVLGASIIGGDSTDDLTTGSVYFTEAGGGSPLEFNNCTSGNQCTDDGTEVLSVSATNFNAVSIQSSVIILLTAFAALTGVTFTLRQRFN